VDHVSTKDLEIVVAELPEELETLMLVEAQFFHPLAICVVIIQHFVEEVCPLVNWLV
jgi:hypothetical protein